MLTEAEIQEIAKCYNGCTWDPSKETAPVEPDANAQRVTFNLSTGRCAHLYYQLADDSVVAYKVV